MGINVPAISLVTHDNRTGKKDTSYLVFFLPAQTTTHAGSKAPPASSTRKRSEASAKFYERKENLLRKALSGGRYIPLYHISKHHPLSYDMTETGWTRVEAWGAKTGRRNVLHIMNRERIGQRRGVPFLAPVIEALKQLGRYTDAELVAAVVSGMFTVFIEKESASSDGGFGEIIPEDAQVDAGDDSTIELAPGAIVDLNEGEKAHDMNPGRPNTAFDGFVVAICRQIGAALEIPYELLVKNFNASYSASRGALLEAWKMFRMYRTWLANDFCQPVYEEWFAEAVAKGRIPAPGFFSDPLIRKAYTGAEWNGPAQGLLNPVQEVTAAEKRVQNGFSTRDREAMEMNGSDFYRNAAQLKREEKMLREVKENGENGNAAGKTEE